MDARHAAGENLPFDPQNFDPQNFTEREFLPVSPTDPIYLRAHPALAGGGNFQYPHQFQLPFVPRRFEQPSPPARPSALRPFASPRPLPAEQILSMGSPFTILTPAGEFTDTQVPSSQEPSQADPEIDAGQSSGAQIDAGQSSGAQEHETEPDETRPPAARRRRPPAAVTGKQRSKPAGNQTGKTRFHWNNFATMSLIEVKKGEEDEAETLVGREQCVNADVKWKRLEEKLSRKGIVVIAKKIKSKWKKLSAEWRKINDFSKLTGKPPYWTMTADEKEKAKLPLYFLEHWFESMASFLQNKAVNNPCLSESEPPPRSDAFEEPARPETASEFGGSATDRAEDTIESARFNSGKRKKDVSKSAGAIVSAMSSFSESFVSCEDKKEEREKDKQKWAEQSQEKHFQWLVEAEDRREAKKAARSEAIVGVLSVIAGAFANIAGTIASRAQADS